MPAEARGQINLRLPGELRAKVRREAAASGRSVNQFVVDVLAAAVNGGAPPETVVGRVEKLERRVSKVERKVRDISAHEALT